MHDAFTHVNIRTSKHRITMVYSPCFGASCKYRKLIFINFSTIASWLSSIASSCSLWVLKKENTLYTLHKRETLQKSMHSSFYPWLMQSKDTEKVT